MTDDNRPTTRQQPSGLFDVYSPSRQLFVNSASSAVASPLGYDLKRHAKTDRNLMNTSASNANDWRVVRGPRHWRRATA